MEFKENQKANIIKRLHEEMQIKNNEINEMKTLFEAITSDNKMLQYKIIKSSKENESLKEQRKDLHQNIEKIDELTSSSKKGGTSTASK